MLQKFLQEKPLYYSEIDYSRMPRVYKSIKEHLKLPKIIHIIGTNGKGTTGRFLASALYSLGFSTGHYSSPHIINFNERIWLNSKDVNDIELDRAHSSLLNLLSKEDADSLSYFEYTTLLAMVIFQDLEYVVLEAGLGGEYDATSVFENILTLVTPIDIDHEAFLGTTIKEIATTKLNAIQKQAIIANQTHQEVYEVASLNSLHVEMVDDILNEEDLRKIEQISERLLLASYLKENLKLAICALKSLDLEYKVDTFNNSKLFGRLTKYRDNIILDVGHNVLAAHSILQALKEEKYILVYNSYRDKNYKEILTILKPITLHVELIDIEDLRVEDEEIMQNTLNLLDIKYKKFTKVKVDQNYLVFGSFSVVEEFLKVYDE